MRKGMSTAFFAFALTLAVAVSAWAGSIDPPRYFGPGEGYPDLGSKYFYNYYPPDRWSVYGYGTGHMGMGYGPYVYGGRPTPQIAQDRPDFGMPVIRPKLKRIRGNEALVSVPHGLAVVTELTVDVLSFNGAVIQTGTATTEPFAVKAILPEGAVNVRVTMRFADGFNSTVFPIMPVR